ncbi:MAG: hypothetical protein HKN82_19400 [Akkermansiaceae bacterium]|nr:hypothetical protein [Akkermansiaceae bacterium]NNM30134.1 hypothetical protein [Akkermansiaceae bacterium]
MAALGLFLPLVLAQSELQIDWGSAGVTEKMILSDGTALQPAEFVVEIGVFEPGFTPTMANIVLWAANWRTFDAITPADLDDSDFWTDDTDPDALFQGSANLDALQHSDSEDAAVPFEEFAVGAQAYIWVYNQLELDSAAQWALLTSADDTVTGDAVWSIPDADAGHTQTSVSWQLSQADTAIVGAVGDGTNIIANGGGTVTDTSTDFVLRLHGAEPVPEPSVALLAALAALLALPRRR